MVALPCEYSALLWAANTTGNARNAGWRAQACGVWEDGRTRGVPWLQTAKRPQRRDDEGDGDATADVESREGHLQQKGTGDETGDLHEPALSCLCTVSLEPSVGNSWEAFILLRWDHLAIKGRACLHLDILLCP